VLLPTADALAGAERFVEAARPFLHWGEMGRALGIIWVCEWIVVCDAHSSSGFFVIKSLAANSVDACAPLAETVLKKPMNFPKKSVMGEHRSGGGGCICWGLGLRGL
jgi:hypothetical protein